MARARACPLLDPANARVELVNDFLARIESAPVTAAVFVAYLAIAFLTDPMNPTTAQLIAYGGAVPMLVADGEGWRLLS